MKKSYETETGTVLTSSEHTSKRRRTHRRGTLSRVASIVLVVLVLGFAGMGVAQAAGYDVFGAVATWTEDIFTIRDQGGNLEVSAPVSHEPGGSGNYDSLQDALDAYGITTPIAPKWIPKGYNAESVTATTTNRRVSFSATYISSEKLPDSGLNKAIYVDIGFDYTGIGTWHVQKDADDPEVYEAGGVEHYIMTNTGDTVAAWQQGSCKCTIGSNSLSSKELKKVIDSIYWRH